MPTHTFINPAILSPGTPVGPFSTVDRDGETNTSPMSSVVCRLSSVFWLSQTALRGMGARSLTAQNLLDTGDGVITLLAAELVDAGDRIALTTGYIPVPPGMALVGY